MSEGEHDKIEFLIKYDDDDTERPPASFFAKYPFSIRTFAWSRGEGRHSLHHAQEYLFAQRDPLSLLLYDGRRLLFLQGRICFRDSERQGRILHHRPNPAAHRIVCRRLRK